MSKVPIFEEDAQERMLKGAEIVYKAVSSTLGPKGRKATIARKFGPPFYTRDGVTVARSIQITDTKDTLGVSVGVEAIKNGCEEILERVGDNTSGMAVFYYTLLKESAKLKAVGYSPTELVKGIEEASKPLLEELEKMSEKIDFDSYRVAQVASVSAKDKKIGELIAETIKEIGEDGVIEVEEGHGLESEKEIVKGFTFDKGYISPYMVTNEKKMESVIDNAPILVTDYKIRTIQQIRPLMEAMIAEGQKDLFIVCDDIDSEVNQFFALNRMKDTFRALVVKNPSFGDQRKETLMDIATVTGATFVTEDKGYRLDDLYSIDENGRFVLDEAGRRTINYSLGTARKVIVTADSTTIIDGGGIEEDINTRIEKIKTQAKNAEDKYAKERYKKRAADLSNNVALIKVGGPTDDAIATKKDDVDDAVAAAKAAIESGIVAGGEVTLVNLSNLLDKGTPAGSILYKAMRQPFIDLMKNSGLEPAEWFHLIDKEAGKGVDVLNPDKGLVDMKEVGIIDATKSISEVIKTAISLGSNSIDQGTVIAEEPEENQPMLPPQMMRP